MKYRLDDLGWSGFERLIQTLLKASYGLPVEAWGGRGDWGRDAFCSAPISLKNTKNELKGSSFFQVKFVENANAAGARPSEILKKSIRSEIAEIRRRKNRGGWQQPSQYFFITNSPLKPDDRIFIKENFQAELGKKTNITSLGEKDVAGMLDAEPDIRVSFPEILGIHDLKALINQSINKHTETRTKDALTQALRLSTVFVDTQQYILALQAIEKHNFIVLDGPPEMGKTSIALMLLLQKHLDQWDAFDCRNPTDVENLYNPERKQIFLADDAFGRTEFSPESARDWERAIPRLLRLSDENHYLVWTSRKHLLQKALREMDLSAPAEKFPNPSEVVISAGELPLEDKARILYRHAKLLSDDRKFIHAIKSTAKDLCKSEHFTPERIRRVCAQRIDSHGQKTTIETLEKSILEIVERPTTSMQTSFGALSETHKWVLIALVDSGPFTNVIELLSTFSQMHAPKSLPAFIALLEDLNGSFLKLYDGTEYEEANEIDKESVIDFIHPSYRDLIITMLSNDWELQAKFLGAASAYGIRVALAEDTGQSGEIDWPLMHSPTSHELLERRVFEIIIENDDDEISMLGTILDRSISNTPESIDKCSADKLVDITRGATEKLFEYWARTNQKFSINALKTWTALADALGIEPKLVDIRHLLEDIAQRLENSIEMESIDDYLLPRDLAFLLHGPFTDESYAEKRTLMTQSFSALAVLDAEWDRDFDNSDEYFSEAQRYEEILEGLKACRDFIANSNKTSINIISESILAIQYKIRNLEERGHDAEIEPEDEKSSSLNALSLLQTTNNLDFNQFFSDL